MYLMLWILIVNKTVSEKIEFPKLQLIKSHDIVQHLDLI